MIKPSGLGSLYFSKDGNVYDNNYDAKAADVRYEQNNQIINLLQQNLNNQNIANNTSTEKDTLKEYYDDRYFERQMRIEDKLEQHDIDIECLETLNDRINQGDPRLLAKYEEAKDINYQINSNSFSIDLSRKVSNIFQYLIVLPIALIIGLLAINDNMIEVLKGVIGTYMVIDILLKLNLLRIKKQSQKEVDTTKLQNLVDIEKKIEQSKQRYIKDFEKFRIENYDPDIEKLLAQYGYINIPQLKTTKLDVKYDRIPYSEYINSIK